MTPPLYYCGQEQAPWRNRLKENSGYHGPSLLWKCRQFPTPQCNISLVFSLTIVDTSEYFVKNPDSQNIYKAALQYSKIKKPFFFWRANMRMSFLWPDHFFCDFYILFHKLKDKTIFSLIPHYYGLSLLRVSNNASQLFIDLIGWWHGLITGWICFSVILSSNPQLCL